MHAPFPVVDNILELNEIPGNQFPFGVCFGIVAHGKIRFVRVDARRKADVCAIIGRASDSRKLCLPVSCVLTQVIEIAETVARAVKIFPRFPIKEKTARRGADELKIKKRLRVKTQSPVESGDAVVPLDEIVTGGEKAEFTVATDIAL